MVCVDTEALIAETAARVSRRIRAGGRNAHHLAKTSGVAPTTLDRKLDAPSTFTIGELVRLSLALDTTLSALVSEESAA